MGLRINKLRYYKNNCITYLKQPVFGSSEMKLGPLIKKITCLNNYSQKRITDLNNFLLFTSAKYF